MADRGQQKSKRRMFEGNKNLFRTQFLQEWDRQKTKIHQASFQRKCFRHFKCPEQRDTQESGKDDTHSLVLKTRTMDLVVVAKIVIGIRSTVRMSRSSSAREGLSIHSYSRSKTPSKPQKAFIAIAHTASEKPRTLTSRERDQLRRTVCRRKIQRRWKHRAN